jgi:hypothetical protein
MGAFDDIVNGEFGDLTQGPQAAPLDPNSVRLDGGFLGSVDVPIPQVLQPVAQGAMWTDQNVMAPLSRGITSLPGFVGDAAKWGYDKAVGNETNFGGVTQGIQDTLGVDARPHDAGFVNDVLENVGGGLAGGALFSVGGLAANLAREVPSAFLSTVGQRAGGEIGNWVGGDTGRVIGDVVGSIAGGSTPGMAKSGGNAVLQNTFEKPNGMSGVAYDQLVNAGITPSPGLVGNKQAARTMNSAANFPVVGGTVQARQFRTFEDFQRSLYEASDNIGPRNRPGVEAAMPEQMLGGRMRIAANRGSDNLDGYFRQGYGAVESAVPPTTLVQPDNLYNTVVAQADPFTGESFATQDAVQNFVAREVDPAMVHPQGPTTSGAPLDPGIPFQRARKARTEAFYDAQGGKMVGGAVEQARQGLTRDINDAILTDPHMVNAYPDPLDRQAIEERLRVLDTEYALSNARDISRSGTSDLIDGRLYVGGDRPALKSISETPKDVNVARTASDPGNMAVLQRTAPTEYPQIAAEVVRNEAQGNTPFGPINVSPQVFSSWWNSLDDNSKLIYANERSPGTIRSFPVNDPAMAAIEQQPTPTMDRLNTLGDVGELFRQAGAEANPSGTAPTLATMGLMAGLFTHPLSTLGGMASGGVMARGASGQEMARIIAGRGPTTEDYMLDALARGFGHVANQQTAPQYGGPR